MFAKAAVLLLLKSGTGCQEREHAFVHGMKVTAPLDAVKKHLGCTCVSWSTSDEMDHSICGKELKNRVVKNGE